MPREHVDYRNNIEQLNRRYPEKEMLTRPEVMQILGVSTYAGLNRFGLPFIHGKVSKAALARVMCG